ncbi:FAD binding domain-containing protein [Falsiroseomonas oryzae]|uniref:FAD binding domain-containing protein n=1 Tax=Falsiroseomonas oryzae TaxID=2766473 RepID=UPI0022EB6529|nr:xanthine dehydrogenase family protein subunit M [Roseomonas sp. MO-31]
MQAEGAPTAMHYAEPETLAEALSALSAEGARCLAGGQSLVAMMNAGLLAPPVLVSLRRVPGLDAVEPREDGGLRLGAMARHFEVARLQPRSGGAEIVVEAARRIGHPAIRNQGTIGGSIAHADPAADYPTAITCAEAVVQVAGPQGARAIPAADFFHGYYETACAPDEIVIGIEVPPGPPGARAHYEKLMIVDGDFAVVSVAVMLAMERGACSFVRLAIGAVAATPLRLADAEAALLGTALDDATLARAGALLAEAADPVDDMRGSAAFRRKLIPRLLRRAVAEARAKAEAAHA